MESLIDLHIHTTASDGTDTPAQAVERAKALGLAAIAITDHDNVDGVAPALAAGQALGLEVIPGIEISADYLGNKAHIVGLFIDPASPALRPALDWAVNERAGRNEKIVAAMAADGFDISLEALHEAYPDSLLGRPHMAEYLMKKGYVTSVKEAFNKYLGEGCPYYRGKERMPMEQAVQVIRQAGGVAVLAHPLQYGYEGQALEDFLQQAKAMGCAALEAYYSEHSPAQQAFLLDKAQELGLALSGGSDFHGSRKPHIQMGSGIENGLAVPYSILPRLRALRP
jgi:hypothetical protein